MAIRFDAILDIAVILDELGAVEVIGGVDSLG